MNREQKAAVIDQIAADIKESSAVLAVDYRGITVGQIAELRGKLGESGASLRVVKNSLTERAADQVGVEDLKALLAGPTALTFVRGDVALAAKAIADQARATQLLPFKGGIMDGTPLTPDEVGAISRLPARDVLYGQLVGLVASPISGLVRSLNGLISGVAIQLAGVLAKKESGELPAGEPPAQAVVETAPAEPPAQASSDDAPAASADAPSDAPASGDSTGEGSPLGVNEPQPDKPEAAAESAAEVPAVEEAESGTEAESGAPAAEAVPAAEEAPAAEETPVVEQAPGGEETPAAAEETPAGEETPAEEALAQDAAPVADEQDQADPEPGAPAENDNQTDASADPVEAKEKK